MKTRRNFLPAILVFTIPSVLVLITAFMFPFTSGNNCGTERWDVKTLMDKESSKIKWTAIDTTVKYLTKLIQPSKKNKKLNKDVRFGYEFNTYNIHCKIREFRKEDDGDYHLVLVDINDSTCTMVGEIVNPECPELSTSNSIFYFISTREDFEKFKLPNNKVQSGTYIITGVCFFDKIHGQLGVAPNGVEIHPIMDIFKDSK